jgi:hypothetical protein
MHVAVIRGHRRALDRLHPASSPPCAAHATARGPPRPGRIEPSETGSVSCTSIRERLRFDQAVVTSDRAKGAAPRVASARPSTRSVPTGGSVRRGRGNEQVSSTDRLGRDRDDPARHSRRRFVTRRHKSFDPCRIVGTASDSHPRRTGGGHRRKALRDRTPRIAPTLHPTWSLQCGRSLFRARSQLRSF